MKQDFHQQTGLFNKKCHKGDNRCKEFVVLFNQRKDRSPKIKDWKVVDKGTIKGEQVCSIKYQQIYNKYKVILPKVICEE